MTDECERGHLDGTAASHDRVVLRGAANDHDGIVNGSLGLLDELLRSTAQDDCARLRLRTAGEEVVPIGADLLLNKKLALSQRVLCDAVYRRQDGTT